MLEKVSVTQTVARRLQEMIRSGELPAGKKIPSQRILSERLAVSRPSLREALLTLETLGLVRTLPARGTFVVDPQVEKAPLAAWRYDDAFGIKEVFQARIMIEGEICRLSAGHVPEGVLAQLAQANADFEEAWKDGDLVAHVEADLRFHSTIADACPNKMIQRLYHSVERLLTESQRQPIPNTARARMEQSMREHRAILSALGRGDSELAENAMREHIRNTAGAAGVKL